MFDQAPTRKGTQLFPQSNPPPLRTHVVGPGAATAAGRAVIERNDGEIRQFVARCRADYALSSLQIYQSHMSAPELDADYLNLQGAETLTLRPQPVGHEAPEHKRVEVQVPNVAVENIIPDIPVAPDIPLFLMVLYAGRQGENGVAAFPMDQISPKLLPRQINIYNGLAAENIFISGSLVSNQFTAAGSDWGGKIIPHAQYRFGNAGVILAPVNFNRGSNNGAATKRLCLSTTMLQSLETLTEAAHLPIMNGSAAQIYTALDVYGISGSQISRVGDAAAKDMMPYAITEKGVYYYTPTWSTAAGLLTLQLSYRYPLQKLSIYGGTDTYPPNPGKAFQNFYGLDDDASADLAAKVSARNKTVDGYAAPSVYYDEVKSVDDTTYGDLIITVPNTPLGPQLSQFVDYTGYYATSKVTPNGAPKVSIGALSYTLAPGLYRDATDGHYVQGPAATSDLTGQMPYPSYTTPARGSSQGDQQTTVMVDVKATSDVVYSDPTDNLDYVLASYFAARASYTALVAGGNPGATVFEFTNLTDDSVLSDPSNPPTTTSTDFTQTGWDAGLTFLQSHCPKVYTQTGGYDRTDNSGTLSFFGDDASSDGVQTFGEGDATYFLIEPFPPAPTQSPTGDGYATVAKGTSNLMFEGVPPFLTPKDGSFDVTITTPYGKYTGTKPDSFQPWLHVSNGVHYAQGFKIDDTPYLFLDGEDFLKALTKALDCEAGDIRMLAMDVPLDSIRALSGIQVNLNLT